ncbi:unnamed protein product, partial [Mesorhabditis spiculigera]
MTTPLTSPKIHSNYSPQRLTSQVGSETWTGPVCRICLRSAASSELIEPCGCAGSVAFVHRECLGRWVDTTQKTLCGICHQHYEYEKHGLRPFRECTWPHALGSYWEDEVRKEKKSYGLSDIPEVIGAAVGGSAAWYKIWWFIFALNFVYYGTVLVLVTEQWIVENTVYTFKNKAKKHR